METAVTLDTAKLVDSVIKTRDLSPVVITAERDRLRFNPGTFGDADYICNVVAALSAADKVALVKDVKYVTGDEFQIGLRAIHVDWTKATPEMLMDYVPAAVLAIAIARKLQVDIA